MSYLLDTDICVYWLKGHKTIEQNPLSPTTKNTLEELKDCT
jgi:hypothetical protein